ncbi:CGNR zinc finger domain-containing protein [Glycomyces sp. TRM65418]|uniref:CGNR zinc finger domain-containing protein n=1 Tax=Glycomyces sp. TRM65418 TaxID=2867006 RepID=UPI001D16073D|nr:CGNR zinc finger domain-containing protein [Glycomyces sp. TRM65418]MCC3763495.1 CGNR zinc finger domain-containing protein [Glycomyces sp. TRM65418]
MVALPKPRPRPPWEDGHFVGGHVVLDLTNTVFDRAHPVADNELLKTPSAALAWCASVGLLEDGLPEVSGAAADALVSQLRAVREDAWAVFDAVARTAPIPEAPFGALLERGGAGLRDERLRGVDASRVPLDFDGEPDAIPAALSLSAVQALFTLPRGRIRACARCGWLFLDSSRGGRRRWCSMGTCGNREKASRHRRGKR